MDMLSEFLSHLDDGRECGHCGMMSFTQGAGPCLSCNKDLVDRCLRPTTMDTAAKDYSEVVFPGTEPEDDCSASRRDNTSSPSKGRKVNSGARQTVGMACCDGADPEDREAVVSEFKSLMISDGKGITENRDDTASKYVRYMNLLFDSGKFVKRADFFATDARVRAYGVFMTEARRLSAAGAKTPEHKLINNMKWGFEKYAELAPVVFMCSKCMSLPMPDTTLPELDKEDTNLEDFSDLELDEILKLVK